MPPFVPSLLLLLLLPPSTQSDAKPDSFKVVISEGCATPGDSADGSRGKELDLAPGSPLVLTHRIKLVPSGPGSGSCGCEADFGALRERLERLEREVSTLGEKCGGADGGCCASKESKGAGCSIKPDVAECPNECSDQGRCEGGRCVCFPGFSGPDCSESNCPGNCHNSGRCLNGQCLCDPGFSGPDCSRKACPDDCGGRGRCVDGKCVCNSGFTGADCSETSCPGNCSNRGRCVDGRCICRPGFAGPACSARACPDNCNGRGRCVNGKCVCDAGFAGADCSEIACLGNCNKRGRCIDGQCVCDDGFGGPDCSDRTCPNDCSDHGRCINGKCVCEAGFTGDDCSENACPGNCNNRGRCVGGQCVCNDGFKGADCSEKACPNDCSDRGKCVNGKCVCNVGSAGPDCSAKGCPNNCSNKGRCMKGRCVCRRGFTGPDCSQCEDGMTGPNCDTAMSGVSQLSARDITETSVTLAWTPPPVQYDTYHIAFSSQKEGDQRITAQVEGGLTTFTQTGLAAGQEYGVTVTGEIDGRRGAESAAEFTTLVSGPTNLRVVKTTSTSAVVQWEKSRGEIDRYRLTIVPSDGAGRTQEMTAPVDQDSAHIQQLEAGRLYDVAVVAEKGGSQSKPATTQAVPGTTSPGVATAALTSQVTLEPTQGVGDLDQEFKPSPEVQVKQGSRADESAVDSVKVRRVGPKKDPSAITRYKPAVSRKIATEGTRPKLGEKPPLSRKPEAPGRFLFNATGKRIIGPGPLKKPQMGQKKKAPIVPKKPKPAALRTGNKTLEKPSTEASSTKRRDDKSPARMPGTDSERNGQRSSEEPKVQPDVGVAGQGNDSAPASPAPPGTVQSQEKKCLNKIKVTHIRLPHKDRHSRYRGDETAVVGNPLGLDQNSFETDGTPPSDVTPPSAETDPADSPDPLHVLVINTFDKLNITTFSVRLSKPSDLSDDEDSAAVEDAVRKQIVTGPKSSFSSSSSSLTTSQPTSSPSLSLASPSTVSSSSTAAPPSSLTHFISSPTSSLSPSLSSSSSSPPSSSSSSDSSDSVESNELDVDNGRSTADAASPEERNPPPSGEGGAPHLHHTSPKHGFIRRLRQNFGSFQNKTRLNLRGPHRSPLHLNISPGGKTETRHSSTKESSSSLASEESSSVEVSTPARDDSGDQDGTTTPASPGVEPSQKTIQTERGRIPGRRPPTRGVYMRRPFSKKGSVHNQTRPNMRIFNRPSQPLNVEKETQKEQTSPSAMPAAASPPVFEESHPAEGPEPVGEGNEDTPGIRISTSNMSNKLNQTRGSGLPPSHRPATKAGHFHRPQQFGGPFKNKMRPNLRPPQHPLRGPVRKPWPNRKLNGSAGISVERQTSQQEKDSTPEVTANQSGEQDVPRPAQGVHIRQAGEQGTAEVTPSPHMDGRDTTVRTQNNKFEKGDIDPIHSSGDEETSTQDSNFDSNVRKQSAVKDSPPAAPGRPAVKQNYTRPVTLPKRQPPPSRMITGQHGTLIRPYSSGTQRGQDPKAKHTAKRVLDSNTGQRRSPASKPQVGSDVPSSGVTREPLDHVGVTNRTSGGFTLVWDSPEGKYKHFVVTRKEVGEDGQPNPKSVKKDQERPEEDTKKQGGNEEEEEKRSKASESESRNGEDENRIPERVITHTAGKKQSSTTVTPPPGRDKTFREVLPASARHLRFEDLPPRTSHTITLMGKGPGLLSRLHKLVISTGPEPPSAVVFSQVTENSLTVSWTKPKSQVDGFKVTYTHEDDGEPVSVSLDSQDSSLSLSQLSPGSSYEVNIVSVLGLDESDPIVDVVATRPDPPTNLRAVNVTDREALLLWRPALAAVDEYAIVYGSGTGSEMRVTVSGNAAEQPLSGLEESTTYTITISSRLGDLQSSAATTSFTTTGSGSDGPRDLEATDVTPRTARLSWKPPSNPVGRYRLTYQSEGGETQEVSVDAAATEHNLTGLRSGSVYTVQLQAEAGGRYTSAISTEFTTGTLRFPFPSDCSQELLNGIRTSGPVEIFPQGSRGTPLMVYCDMETDGGGWTVFQRRKDGSVDFFRGWKDYVSGFGDLNGEFWLGLQSLQNLTTATRMILRVDLRDGAESAFAKYSEFEVSGRSYKLSVGGYSGTAGDSLSYHNNRIFSTKDRDLAPFITRCAMSYRGGWWYKNCHEANLNGLYGIDVQHQGVIWTSWKGKEVSIAFTEMKMRPASFSPPA